MFLFVMLIECKSIVRRLEALLTYKVQICKAFTTKKLQKISIRFLYCNAKIKKSFKCSICFVENISYPCNVIMDVTLYSGMKPHFKEALATI